MNTYAASVLSKSGALSWETVALLPGSHLAGVTCSHPLAALGFSHDVPVLSTTFVEHESGTGLVHVAPSLGPDDFALARANHLPVVETVCADGTLSRALPSFGGLHVLLENGREGPAFKVVSEALFAAGAVVSTWRSTHKVACSWRSHAPLLYRTTDQWFVKVTNGLEKQSLEALEHVDFMPSGSRQRMVSMLRGRPDWCVSRQRSWGVPLGLFTSRATGDVLADPDVLDRVWQTFAQEGSDSWYSRPKS